MTSIRPARSSDRHSLAGLESRAFRTYYAAHRFTERQFQSYLSQPQTIAYVAEARPGIVGYVLGRQLGGQSQHLARLLSLAVEPTCQGHGLGRRLLSSFIAKARRRGCRSVSLEVATVNAPAIRLFTEHGFVSERTLPSYYSARVSGRRMRLTLARG